MKYIHVLLVIFLMAPLISQAQRTIVTEEGEVIQLNQDGSWVNIDDKADSPVEESTPACDFRVNERDQFVEEQWLVMQSRSFISHTRPEVASEVKWKDFAQAQLRCAYIGGTYSAFVRWVIQTDVPEEELGGLSEGNKMTFFLKDSKNVIVEYEDSAQPRKDFEKDETRLASEVNFSKEQVKALLEHPVEKVGMQWDDTYAEYPVKNPDLLINQFRCIISNID